MYLKTNKSLKLSVHIYFCMALAITLYITIIHGFIGFANYSLFSMWCFSVIFLSMRTGL